MDSNETRRVSPSQRNEAVVIDELLEAQTVVGPYTIDRVLGLGGCGVVYAARETASGTPYALKVLRVEMTESGEMVERFEREARALMRVKHPHIVRVHEVGRLSQGQPYYVMDLMEGGTLKGLLDRQGRFSPEAALAVLQPIGSAVHAAHAEGIVHRDIKSTNIGILRAGATEPHFMLLDFGIAKLMESRQGATGLTTWGRVIGTPTTMAPEQILGHQVDVRTDVYALGVLIYELLTGRLPFASDDLAQLRSLQLHAVPPRPSLLVPLSPQIDALVLQAMHKRAEHRYPSALALVEAFQAAVGEAARAGTERRAIGLYVETLTGGEDDDADTVASALDRAERMLRGSGCQMAMRTWTTLLAVRLLPPELAREAAERDAARALASCLHAELERAGVPASVWIHVDAVIVRKGDATQPQLEGGITRPATWGMPDRLTSGAFATSSLQA
jgi:serine/threonine-protein kinase